MAEKNRNVTTHRLLIGFSSIVLLLIVFGVISLIGIRTLSKVTRTIYNHPLVVSNASLRATVSMIKMHRSMKDVALFDFPSEINIAINAVNKQERMVLESLDTIKKNILGDEGQKLENETRRLFVNWKPVREEVIKLVHEGQRKEAAKITMGKGADYVLNLENKMLELTSYARNKATDFMRHGEKVHTRVIKSSIILMSLGLLLSVFIAFFTIRRTQTTEKEILRSKILLESSIESPKDMIILSLDREYRYLYFNKTHAESMSHVFGTRPQIGDCIFDHMKSKDDIDKVKEHYNRALAGEGHVAIEDYGEDQVRYYYEIRYNPIYNEKNEIIGVTSFAQNITERKQAEEQIKASLKEKEVLLREIHHRVKNNMQLLISLLRLQADKIEDKKYADMFKEGEDRIRSMSLIHEKLYQTQDFANINFGEHIKSLVDGLFVSYGVDTDKVSLNIDIKDVSIDLENAIPCGLIINELVSNSLKYAFPQGREGKISIALRPFNEDELELTVSDDGVGISEDLDIEKTDTMGLTLVKVLAGHQLDGKIDLDRTEGTQFNIKFKRTA